MVDEAKRIATVDVGGVRRNVSLSLLEMEHEVAVGTYVLIHVGFAISRIDEAEAQATLALLNELGSYQEEMASFISTNPLSCGSTRTPS